MKLKKFRYEIEPMGFCNDMWSLKISIWLDDQRVYHDVNSFTENHFESLFDRLVKDATLKLKQALKEKN